MNDNAAMPQWRFLFAATAILVGTSISVRPATAQPTVVNLDETLPASGRIAGDGFGQSVAASGNVIAVGAPRDDINSVTTDTGSVYAYRRQGSEWVEEQKLIDSDGAANDQFGLSVAASDDMIVVGAPAADGNQFADAGAAYSFRWNGAQWIEEQRLTASDGVIYDTFGTRAALSADVIVIGSPQNDLDNRLDAGAAYVYRFDGAQWVEEQKLFRASERSGDARGERFGDFFGSAVSVSGDVIVVGAYADDDLGQQSGSAYVYRFNGTQWVEEQELHASDGADGEVFGISVAASGNMIVVGAESGGSSGGPGSAYVFHFNGTQWIEEQKLLGSDPARFGFFGQAVAASSSVIVVGAPGANLDSGLAYVGVLEGGADTDEDGLSDDDEIALGTDPGDPDTDDDGLLDGTEVELALANNSDSPDPLNPDSDGDGLLDGEEVLVTGTDPSNPDTDGDGVPDNIDPNPLDPGESNGELELATRTVCESIRELDLALFNGPNDNANSGRRNSLATRCAHAANRIAAGHHEAAISLLSTVLAKVDGDPAEPDWVFVGVEQASAADQLSEVIALLLGR